MQGSDVIWLASIILGMTLLGWLVLDWLESAQGWEERSDSLKDSQTDAHITPYVTGSNLGRSEQYTPDPLDAELEMMLCYPLDPFSPSLLWRPLPREEWVEVQEATDESLTTDAPVEGEAPSQASA